MLVIKKEVADVAGVVVAIHSVPVEGDVGAVLGGLEVANMIVLGSCTVTKKKRRKSVQIRMLSSYSKLPVRDPESSIAAIKRIVIFTELASSFNQCCIMSKQCSRLSNHSNASSLWPVC